ncbi:hypothetical protein ES703_93019 [subsurface metagenome]
MGLHIHSQSLGRLRFRVEELGHDYGSRHREKRGGNQMSRYGRKLFMEEKDIHGEHSGGDGSHRSREDGHQFRFCHLLQVRTNHQSRFDTDKYIARSTQRFRSADAHQPGEHIRKTPDQKRHDSQIIQSPDHCGEKDYCGKGLEGQDVSQGRLARFGHCSGRISQAAEKELCPGSRTVQHDDNNPVHKQKELGSDRHPKYEDRKKEL